MKDDVIIESIGTDYRNYIDKTYKIGATGVLLNANEIGWGYDKPNSSLKPISSVKRSWHLCGL